MGTNVTYNGVTLENCLTLEFDQQPQRDDSHTDKWFDRFLITVKSCMSLSMLNERLHGVHGRIGGADIATLVASAQSRLSEDRKPFSYTMDGEVLVSSGTGLNDEDQDNGPKVRSIKIVHHSQSTITITFSVEIARNTCTQNPSPVIGNRWSCIDDVDENWRVTRHWRGKLRLCGKQNPVQNPHDFRAFVIPPLQGGFKRQRMHFVAEPNMLELAYEVTDIQMLGDAAPAPAIKMAATHTESFAANGMKSIGEFNIRLDGERGADKGKMIERAMQIAVGKLAFAGSRNEVIVKSLILVDHIGEDVNAIEVRAVLERAISDKALLGANNNIATALGTLALTQLGKPMKNLKIPNYDPNRARVPGEYGTATIVGLFACHLQSPCVDDHQMPQDKAADPKGDQNLYGPGADSAESTYSIGKVSDGFSTPGLNLDHAKSMWTFAQVSSRYMWDTHRIALPKGLPNTNNRASTAAVVRLAPPTCRRQVVVKVERVGEWPTAFRLEDFDDHNGIRHWLVDWTPDFAAPQFAADGRVIYSADFVYMYALSRCPDDYDSLAVGFLPWDNRDGRANDYPGTSLIPPDGSRGLS